MSNPSRNTSPQIQISGNILIGGLRFHLAYRASGDNNVFEASWEAKGQTLELPRLSESFAESPLKFEIPQVIGQFGLSLSRISFKYDFKKSACAFTIEADHYGALTISTNVTLQERRTSFRLQLKQVFPLRNVPVLKDGVGDKDSISLESLSVTLAPKGKVELGAAIRLVLFGKEKLLQLPEETEKNASPALAPLQENTPPIKWIDINKDAGPIRLTRLGFSMGEGEIAVYVDGGLRLSFLLLEFLGLHLSFPLKKEKSVGFGIQGLTVTVSRPPLLLSGGLYISKEAGMLLYTGEICVGIGKFKLTALGSYGAFESGEPSLFIFLLLSYPLGGPPVFYITGLSGGAGYNRSITLPGDVKDVKKFPFVSAAMQQGPLTKNMSPAHVLKEMNASIVPQQGQYFASLGVRFTSFGLVDTFVLANVMFGKRFEISVLGISSVSVPPQSADKFVYVELLVKAVIAPAEGLVSIMGVLTSESFLFDKNCKLQGGFAFVSWFGSHPNSGDFVLTLGGYAPGFSVDRYPQVDRVGINWKISDNLSLTAGCYFALTPSCIMMGGNLSIIFELGRLKAWFIARLDFFMQWKPFAYSLSVYISLGVSFRWDFFPFYHTFTLELSASLDLWGPPFGGRAHITWWVISFTISFGSSKPDCLPVKWKEFADSFLPLPEASNTSANYLKIQAVGGIIRENKEKTERKVSPEYLIIEISSCIPCSCLKLEGVIQCEYPHMGVVPMGISNYDSTLSITVLDRQGNRVNMKGEAVRSNLPKALWDQNKPDPADPQTLKIGAPTGIKLTCPSKNPEGVLPGNGNEGYDMAILCENERLPALPFSWVPAQRIEHHDYPEDDIIGQIQNSIMKPNEQRKQYLATLKDAFGVFHEHELQLNNWGNRLDQILVAEPELQAIGKEKSIL